MSINVGDKVSVTGYVTRYKKEHDVLTIRPDKEGKDDSFYLYVFSKDVELVESAPVEYLPGDIVELKLTGIYRVRDENGYWPTFNQISHNVDTAWTDEDIRSRNDAVIIRNGKIIWQEKL